MRLRAAPCQFLCLAIINRPIVLYLYNHTTSKDISLDYCVEKDAKLMLDTLLREAERRKLLGGRYILMKA